MKDRYLYIILIGMVVMLVLALRNMHNETPKRLLSDSYLETPIDDRFIRTYNFVGVEKKNIIFEVTERGD